MAYLHLPPRFRRPKPRWPARIDLSHPLAEGLVFAPLPDGHACIDLVTGEFALPRTGGVRVDWRVWDHPQYVSTNDGHHDAVDEVYWQEASATDGGWYWPSIKQEDPRSLSGVDKASWAFWHLQASAPADDFGRLMDKSTGGSGADGWTIYYDKADLRLVFRHSGNADQAASSFHTGGDLDKWWPWVFTRNGTVCRWYQDRRMNDVTNDGTCAAGNFSTASADLAFGVSSPSWTAAYRPNNGGLALGFLWSNRVLEQDEARQWAADPWGLVEETADISYFLPLVVPRRSHMSLWGDFRRLGGPYPAAAPGGTPYTAELTPAAFNFTAQSLEVQAADLLELTPAVFNMVAQPIEVRAGYQADLTAAVFDMVAQTIEVQAATVIELTAPAFNFTPADLSVLSGDELELTAAVFDMAAQPITVFCDYEAVLTPPEFSFTPQPVEVPSDGLEEGTANLTSALTDGIGVTNPMSS